MFQKADGKMVWLRSDSPLSYLVFDGQSLPATSAEILMRRLGEHYPRLCGYGHQACFSIVEQEGGQLLFGVERNGRCAFTFLGEYRTPLLEGTCPAWPSFQQMIDAARLAVSQRAKVALHFHTIRTESALRHG